MALFGFDSRYRGGLAGWATPPRYPILSALRSDPGRDQPRLRRRSQPRPARLVPSSAIDAGSGAGVTCCDVC
jgi:hypothetical protein